MKRRGQGLVDAVGLGRIPQPIARKIVPLVAPLSVMFVLSLLVGFALNSLIAVLHELGHYLVGAIAASAEFIIIVQNDNFPPILWITGRVDVIGDLRSNWGLFYLAPTFTTLVPAAFVGFLAWKRRDRISLRVLRNALVVAWMLEALFALFPSFNGSAGASDGAIMLGQAGIAFAASNPVALLFASWPGWVAFRFAWWVTATYVAAKVFFRNAQLSFIVTFAAASFMVTWAIATALTRI